MAVPAIRPTLNRADRLAQPSGKLGFIGPSLALPDVAFGFKGQYAGQHVKSCSDVRQTQQHRSWKQAKSAQEFIGVMGWSGTARQDCYGIA